MNIHEKYIKRCIELAKNGASIVLNGRNEQRLQETEQIIRSIHPHVVSVCCDVSDIKASEALIETAIQQFGRLDILVNNVGVSMRGTVAELNPDVFKKVFESNCVACHKPDGGGSIGPNLTDENWILGGGIKNVFTTITEGGRDGKGMVAWKGTLKPSEIQQVASYVLSLKGTNPTDAKAPEGDVWVE